MDGVPQQLRAVMEPEFAFNVLAMGLDRLQTDAELERYFPRAQAGPEQSKDVKLAIAQRFEPGIAACFLPKRVTQNQGRHLSTEVELTVENAMHRIQQLG